MLLDKLNIDVRKYIRIFERTFKNFSNKTPLILSFNISPPSVFIYLHKDDSEEGKLIIEYKLNYYRSIKNSIRDIKNQLTQYFPIMTEIIESEYSAIELNELVDQKEISTDDVGNVKKLEEVNYRIDRVVLESDEILILDLTENKLFNFRLKTPVTTFLRKLQSEDMSPKNAWKYFREKSEFLDERVLRKR